MKKYWLLVPAFCLILGLLAIPKLLVVPRAAAELAEQLQAYFSAEKAEVRLGTRSGWELVFGRIPSLEARLQQPLLGNLRAAEMEIFGRGIRFDPRRLRQGGPFAYQSAASLEAELTVWETSLNEVFWQEADPERNLSLAIHPHSIVLEGAIPFLGRRLDVRLSGVLEPWGPGGLRLVLQNLELEETRVPPILLEVLNRNYDFVLDLQSFPIPIVVSGVSLQESQMLISIGVVK